MRPTYRPKHERRIIENSGAMPHVNYTSGTRGKRASITSFDKMPQRKDQSNARMFAEAFALVLGGFALMYAITWIYGHFRWGW